MAISVYTIKDQETGAELDLSYVVDGTVKARVHYYHSDNTIKGSFNITSVTDEATGDARMNFTSNMSDATYTASGFCNTFHTYTENASRTTSSEEIRTAGSGHTPTDAQIDGFVIGDLA